MSMSLLYACVEMLSLGLQPLFVLASASDFECKNGVGSVVSQFSYANRNTYELCKEKCNSKLGCIAFDWVSTEQVILVDFMMAIQMYQNWWKNQILEDNSVFEQVTD